MAKLIVNHSKQVAQRSSIRGFKDDYHDVDADVVVLDGETHLHTKPVSSCPCVVKSISNDFSGRHAFHGGAGAQ